jgi:predicted acylesterase/phospholipase RssA
MPNRSRFVCAVIQESDLCERLRTYDTRNNGPATPCTIWRACRATSAAPLYFPSIKINDRTYWDGGMNSNNPILQVVQEVRSEFGEDSNIAAIVSIGIGKAKKVDPGSYIFSLLKYAVKEMTNTEKKHAEFKANYPDLIAQYFRFNEEDQLHDIDLADWKKLARVEQIADKYVTSTQGRQLVSDCARKLARQRSVATEDLYNL